MSEQKGRHLTVVARHRAVLPERDDAANFEALLTQARHITGRTYETTLHDHMQAFRLLWHHLEGTGHLRRVYESARVQPDSRGLEPAEVSDLRLFLTLYAQVRGT